MMSKRIQLAVRQVFAVVAKVKLWNCLLSCLAGVFGYGWGDAGAELCHREEAWWDTTHKHFNWPEPGRSFRSLWDEWEASGTSLTRLKESYVFMSSSMRYCSSTTTLVRLGLRWRAQSSQWTTYVFLLLLSLVTNNKLNTSTCRIAHMLVKNNHVFYHGNHFGCSLYTFC